MRNPNVIFNCEACGRHIERYVRPSRHPSRFCGPSCAGKKVGSGSPQAPNRKPNVFFECATCGKHVERYVEPARQTVNHRRFCNLKCAGKGMKGESHPRWKGGRHANGSGYFYVLRPEHPFANKTGHVLEHRLVMEEALGRHLTSEEVVHHINGDRCDNRIGNLRLFATQAEHVRYHNLTRAGESRAGGKV